MVDTFAAAGAPARITIVGTTGSGKSALARRAAARSGHALIDLDDHYWLPGWQLRPAAEFRARVDALTQAPRWVLAGNYTAVRDVVWKRADMIVWLDYGPVETFRRLLLRSVRRAHTGEAICNGNVERWHKLVTPDSILLWFFRSYWRNRRRYGAIFETPGEWRDKALLRIRRPPEAEAWLAGFGAAPVDQ